LNETMRNKLLIIYSLAFLILSFTLINGQTSDLIKYQGDNGLYGYKDSLDRVVFDPIFVHASLFNNGLAYVYIKDKGWTLADSRGYLIKEPIGEFGTPYADLEYKLIRHSIDKKWGFIDRKGNLIIDYQYTETKDFNNGLAPAKIDGKWGCIDTNNILIINPIYENIAVFSDNCAAVRINGLWGFIDNNGELIIEPKYTSVYGFSEGLCAVNTLKFTMANGGIATEVIDKKGNAIFTGMFYFFQPYKNGIASFWEGYDMSGRHIFIDKQGFIIKTE